MIFLYANRVSSCDVIVKTAMLVFLNNGMAAMIYSVPDYIMLQELSSIIMQMFSFVSVKKQVCN